MSNEIKKALYKEKPIAFIDGSDETYTYYKTDVLINGIRKEIKFEIPNSENVDFKDEEPAQLLIRWLCSTSE